MGYTSKAAAITPPVQGQNVWALPANDWSTSDYLEVPEAWRNCILRFEAQGDEDWYFAFGGDTLTAVSATAESTVSSNAITAIGSAPWHLEQNTFVDVDMSLVDERYKKRLALLSETGTATNLLRISRTSGYVKGS